MSKLKFLFLTLSLLWSTVSYAQDDPGDDYNPDWDIIIDETEWDDETEPEQIEEWREYSDKDWKDEVKEYEDYYKGDKPTEIRQEAYDQLNKEGINMPQRHGPVTYDPETGEAFIESEEDYQNRLNDFLGKLGDKITNEAFNLALEVLYLKLQPIIKVLKEKNAAILDKVLPAPGGVITIDPAEEQTKEKQESKRTFKTWVRLAAENIMQTLFKEDAEGKWELQKEQLELLQDVGVIRFLKISSMDWELAQSISLVFPEEVLSYATVVKDIYESGEATVQAGKKLYQSVTNLDSDLNIPLTFEELKGDATNILNNKLTTSEMVNTRRQHLSKTYRDLSKRYREYAEELQAKSLSGNTLKMSDSDRVRVNEIANEYLQESLRLHIKAEALAQANLNSEGLAKKDEITKSYHRYKKIQSMYE